MSRNCDQTVSDHVYETMLLFLSAKRVACRLSRPLPRTPHMVIKLTFSDASISSISGINDTVNGYKYGMLDPLPYNSDLFIHISSKVISCLGCCMYLNVDGLLKNLYFTNVGFICINL